MERFGIPISGAFPSHMTIGWLLNPERYPLIGTQSPFRVQGDGKLTNIDLANTQGKAHPVPADDITLEDRIQPGDLPWRPLQHSAGARGLAISLMIKMCYSLSTVPLHMMRQV
jgi:hypothetical protein